MDFTGLMQSLKYLKRNDKNQGILVICIQYLAGIMLKVIFQSVKFVKKLLQSSGSVYVVSINVIKEELGQKAVKDNFN